MNQTSKAKSSLITQLEDTKALGDAESKDRATLLTKFKALSTEVDNYREKIQKIIFTHKLPNRWRILSKSVCCLHFSPR